MSTRTEILDSRRFVIFSSSDLVILRQLLVAMLFAGFLGILAQIKIFLPGTPVPVTAQVLGVLIAGVVLGSKTASLSVLIYLALGFNGIPWLSAGATGVNVFTIGYLIGFLPAVAIIGFLFNKIRNQKSFLIVKFTCLMLAGIAIIYTCGAAWIFLFTGTQLGLTELLAIAVIPFVPGEMIKLSAAVTIARILK